MMLSEVFLTSVAYIGPKSRTERPRKTEIGTEEKPTSHVIRTPLSRSKVKGQGHQAALLTAVLARQAAAAVGVGTCWPLETAATLIAACSAAPGASAPTGRRWAGHIVVAVSLQLAENVFVFSVPVQ